LHIVDDTEQVVASQKTLSERIGSNEYIFTAELPALGYRCYHARSGAVPVKHKRMLAATQASLENDWWRIEFDPYDGQMTRLYDKIAKVETLKRGNILAAMVDSSDTWSHGYEEFRVEDGRFGNARIEVYEMGDVRATLRITSTYGKSTIDQFVSLHRAVQTIDCTFRINWQERYRMLKLGWETLVKNGEATYDTAYGCQVRDTHGFEEPGQMWFDLTGEAGDKLYGFGVLNDSKYGFDVCGSTMRVTVLRSPAYAHHDRARYDASLPYSIIDQGWQTLHIQLLPHANTWQDAGVVKRAWELNEPAFTHVESAHSGHRSQSASLIGTEAEDILLSVIKKAEDSHALIIRGYETAGRCASTKLHFPYWKKTFAVDFAPHEIKTLRIDLKTWTIKEVNLLEE
jgi:alpha-mannosidase